MQGSISSSLTSSMTASLTGGIGAGQSNPISTAAPFVWYKAFDEGSGIDASTPTTGDIEEWNDISGNGYDAIQTNVNYQPNISTESKNSHNVLDFNGLDEYLNLDSSVYDIGTDDSTVIIFFKTDTPAAAQQRLLTGSTVSGTRYGVILYDDRISVQSSSSFDPVEISITPDTNWHYVVLRKSGTDLMVGYDGQYVTETRTVGVSVTDMEIGRYVNGNQYYFNGQIGEFVMFDRALSDAEIEGILEHMSGAEEWNETAYAMRPVALHTNTSEAALRSVDTTNYVSVNAVEHTVTDSHIMPQLAFENGSYLEQTPFNGLVHFFLRGAILTEDGTFTPLTFNGATDVFLDKDNGKVLCDPVDLTLAAGAKPIVVTRRVAVTGSDIVWNADGSIASGTDNVWSFADNSQTGTRTSGSAAITGLTDTSGLVVGMRAEGTGIPSLTYIQSIDSATQVTLTNNATSSGSATITFNGNFQWDNTVKASGISNSYTVRTTSLTDDYLTAATTLLPYGGSLGETNVSGGALISTSDDLPGQNYPTSALQWYHGWAGRNNEGAEIPGTSASGYLTRSSGAMSQATITSGGSGYDENNKPKAYLSSSGFAEQGMWSACAFIGRVSVSVQGIMGMGDSYEAGGTVAPDHIMTVAQFKLSNYAYNRIGSAQGASAVGLYQNFDERRELFEFLYDNGYRPTHFYNGLGINDFGGLSPNFDVGTAAINNVERINDEIRAIFPSIKIINTTIPECRSTTIPYTGTSTGSNTTTTINDTSKSWEVDELVGFEVYINGGTGTGQRRTIVSNTETEITISTAWSTTPTASSTYEIDANWLSVEHQTAYSAAYEPDDGNPATANGAVQQYNIDMRNKAGVTWDYLIDEYTRFSNATNKYAWEILDVDNWSERLEGAENTPSTSDGIHLNLSAKQFYKDKVEPLVL